MVQGDLDAGIRVLLNLFGGVGVPEKICRRDRGAVPGDVFVNGDFCFPFGAWDVVKAVG